MVVEVVPVCVVVYPVPVDAVWSTAAMMLVLTKSISIIWFLTGTISFDEGSTVTRICVDVEPSEPVIVCFNVVVY